MDLFVYCRNQFPNRRGIGLSRLLRPIRARSTRREGGSPRPAGSGENLRSPTSRRVISPGVGLRWFGRDARANVLCEFPKFQDLFPSAAASSPEGATCRWRGHVAIGQILSLSGPQAAGPTGRLHSPDMFTSGPSESTSILRFHALSRSRHSREASGVCAAILVRRDADYPSTQSDLSLHSGGPVFCPFPPSYWGDSTRRVWDTAFVTGLPPARD